MSDGQAARPGSVLLYLAFLLAVSAAGLEVLLAVFLPQTIRYPAFVPSREFGHAYPPGTVIRVERRGRFEIAMTINEKGYRGPYLEPALAAGRFTVVALGDSYTAGAGVGDGQEYPAVMRRELPDDVAVVNLGVGGYGLAHEIKAFHRIGALYRPRGVILQFSLNDPDENLRQRVTDIEAGRLVFRMIDPGFEGLRRWLGRSWLQRSQLFHALRLAYHAASDRPAGTPAAAQLFHVRLLDAFVAQLRSRGIRLLLVSVEDELERFPLIRARVAALDAAGELEYHDSRFWLRGLGDYRSPEGHLWGERAHLAIGRNLARIVRGWAGATPPGGSAPSR